MCTIRCFEESAKKDFLNGEIPGFVHLYIGEEAALAIRLEATLEEFTSTIHCHPTVAEAVRECALAVDKKAIHIPNRR